MTRDSRFQTERRPLQRLAFNPTYESEINMYSILLALHIAAGSLELLSAFGALVVAKGKVAHRRFGMVYVCGMSLVSITAWTMSAIKPNAFLFAIACFSAFLVASGYARAKNRTGKASQLDWSISVLGFATSLVMLVLGWVSTGTNHIVLLIFGAVSGALSLVELRGLYGNKFKGAERIVSHMRQMMGGTIATVTAVAVVNIQNVQPAWLVWIAPTLLIIPIIIYWSIRLRRTSK